MFRNREAKVVSLGSGNAGRPKLFGVGLEAVQFFFVFEESWLFGFYRQKWY